MTPPEPSTQLQARHGRTRRIRRRVVGSAAALFAATTGGIYVQLVSGHDPALANSTAKAASASTTSAATGSGSTTSASAASTTKATAVTTSQS